MTQQHTPSAGTSEAEIRAALAASILAQRTGRAPGSTSARSPGLARRLADAPPPPHEVNDPAYAVQVLALVGSAAYFAEVAPWWFVAGGGAAALSAAVATHTRLHHSPATLYAASSTLAAGGIVAAGAEWGSLTGVGLAVLGGALFGPLYASLRQRHARAHEKERQAFEAARAERKRDDWEAIFKTAGAADVLVARELNVAPWSNGERKLPAGFALALELGDKAPEGRFLASMTPKIEQLAARRLKLPIRSGTIQVAPRGLAHEWEITVPTRDVLGEDVPFVLESGPRSVNDVIYTAMAADGTGLGVDLMLTPHGMFVGQNNQGKTVFLCVHMVELTRCVDSVVWAISGNKPVRLFKPWLEAFLRGTPSTESKTGYVEPVLDWVCGNDIEEACRVLMDAYKAIHLRQAMASDDDAGDKWIPTPEKPRLTIVIDEAPDLMDNTWYRCKPFDWTGDTVEEDEKNSRMTGYTFAEMMLKIVRLARSEAISLIFLTQRATNTMLGDHAGDIKTQLAYRVSFKQVSAAEASRTFTGETIGVNVNELKQGEIFMEDGESIRPIRGKGCNAHWDVVRAASVAHTVYAQPLDPRTALGLDFYAERWTRPSQQAFLRSLITNPVRTVPGQSPERLGIEAQESARQIPDVAPSIARDQVEQAAEELDTSVEALRERFPELRDLDVNGVPDDEEPPAPTPWGARIDPTLHEFTRTLLDLIASSDLLHAEWVPTQDILRLVEQELPEWPCDSTEGGRRVKWALGQAGVEQPNNPPKISRKRLPQGYHVRDIKLALDRYLRKDDEEG